MLIRPIDRPNSSCNEVKVPHSWMTSLPSSAKQDVANNRTRIAAIDRIDVSCGGTIWLDVQTRRKFHELAGLLRAAFSPRSRYAIPMQSDIERVLISQERIAQRVRELAAQI